MNTLQQQFLRKVEDLSNLLKYPQPTIGMLIKGIWTASLRWSGGQLFEEAENFAYDRFSWRVQDNLAPDARLDRALQLLASCIPLGMIAFRDLNARLDDPAEHNAAESFIDHLASLGFDLRPYMPRAVAA